jgi:hypothetical protein
MHLRITYELTIAARNSSCTWNIWPRNSCVLFFKMDNSFVLYVGEKINLFVPVWINFFWINVGFWEPSGPSRTSSEKKRLTRCKLKEHSAGLKAAAQQVRLQTSAVTAVYGFLGSKIPLGHAPPFFPHLLGPVQRLGFSTYKRGSSDLPWAVLHRQPP